MEYTIYVYIINLIKLNNVPMVFPVFPYPKGEGIYNVDLLLSVHRFLVCFVVMLQAVIEMYTIKYSNFYE